MQKLTYLAAATPCVWSSSGSSQVTIYLFVRLQERVRAANKLKNGQSERTSKFGTLCENFKNIYSSTRLTPSHVKSERIN